MQQLHQHMCKALHQYICFIFSSNARNNLASLATVAPSLPLPPLMEAATPAAAPPPASAKDAGMLRPTFSASSRNPETSSQLSLLKGIMCFARPSTRDRRQRLA